MPSVLITHTRMRGDGPHLPVLKEAGFDVRFPPPELDLTREDHLAQCLGDAESVIAGTEPFSRAVIAGADRLRVIARRGVGYDAVDVQAADEHNIAVTTTPGTNEHSVAEHALSMLLGVQRGFPGHDQLVRRGDAWKQVPLPRLAGSTVGIVGLGRIGQALATRLGGLQVKILAFEPFPNQEFVTKHGIELVELDELLGRSDFVSLHAPVTPQTKGMINAKSLALMKPTAVLVNTARGGLIVEADLRRALTDGGLRAAALDVFETEPLPADDPLLKLDNVLVSPHIAGVDIQSAHDSTVLVAEVLVDLAQGRWPDGCVVNLDGGNGWKW